MYLRLVLEKKKQALDTFYSGVKRLQRIRYQEIVQARALGTR